MKQGIFPTAEGGEPFAISRMKAGWIKSSWMGTGGHEETVYLNFSDDDDSDNSPYCLIVQGHPDHPEHTTWQHMSAVEYDAWLVKRGM